MMARMRNGCRLVLLGIFGLPLLMSCATSRWELLTQDTQHPHAIDIIATAFVDAKHGWAINAVELWKTDDGGMTWKVSRSGDDKYFHSLMFLNQSAGWIVGTKKESGTNKVLVIRTVDGGNSWLESHVEIPSSDVRGASGLQSVSFCNPDIGWAVGADLILRSVDGGQTWEKQRGGNDEVLYGIQCVNSAKAWAVGQDGLILSTEDGGKNWFRQESSTKATLARVRWFDRIGWILGGITEKGILLRTSSDGSKWQRVPIESSEALFDIYLNGQMGWVVGARGSILHSSDKGLTWHQEKSPTENDLVSIFFLDPRHGWISGKKLTVLRLSD